MMKSFERGLVSLLVPGYNVARQVNRLFDSLLAQDYPRLHVVFVNDGSTDETERVVLAYNEGFAQRGWELEYIYQENAGVGAAVNRALKQIKGACFGCIDADDFLAPTAIREKVEFLQTHPEYGLVQTEGYVYDERDLSKPIDYLTQKNPNRFKEEDLIEDYLWERHRVFTPGCYLMRTESFAAVNPTFEIYPSRAGQNYQILLPLLCHYKLGFIDKPLFHYVVYHQSLSHGADSLEKWYHKHNELQRCVETAFIQAALDEARRQDLLYQTQQKYNRLRAKTAYDFGEVELFEKWYAKVDDAYRTSDLQRAQRQIRKPLLLALHKCKNYLNLAFETSALKFVLKQLNFRFKYGQ